MSGSQHSPTCAEQQNSIPPQPLPDFTALAEKLQETAQALLKFDRAQHEAPRGADKAESKPRAAVKQAAAGHEIRSYRIPPFILRDEQELLKSAEADDLLDVLDKACNHLSCLVKLMQHYDEEEDFYGFELNNLGEMLALPVEWLVSLFATLRGFERVRAAQAE